MGLVEATGIAGLQLLEGMASKEAMALLRETGEERAGDGQGTRKPHGLKFG